MQTYQEHLHQCLPASRTLTVLGFFLSLLVVGSSDTGFFDVCINAFLDKFEWNQTVKLKNFSTLHEGNSWCRGHNVVVLSILLGWKDSSVEGFETSSSMPPPKIQVCSMRPDWICMTTVNISDDSCKHDCLTIILTLWIILLLLCLSLLCDGYPLMHSFLSPIWMCWAILYIPPVRMDNLWRQLISCSLVFWKSNFNSVHAATSAWSYCRRCVTRMLASVHNLSFQVSNNFSDQNQCHLIWPFNVLLHFHNGNSDIPCCSC